MTMSTKKTPKAAPLTKSKAAELKDALEKRQLGDTSTEPRYEPPAPSETPDSEFDKQLAESIEVIRSEQKASVSLLQRRLKLGYTNAARIIDELEKRGYIGPSNGAEPREIGELPPAPPEVNDITITSPSGKVARTNAKKLAKLAAAIEALDKPARRTLKPKSEQLDMVTEKKLDVPEPTSPLYIAGKRLKEAVQQEQLNKDEKAEAMNEVLKCMKNAKRYHYRVEGYVFELMHKGAADSVKVVKPK